MKILNANLSKIIIFMAILAICSLGSLSAVPFQTFAEKDNSEYPLYETVEWKEGMIPVLDLLPDVPGSDIIRNRFFNYEPRVTVQRLYRLPLKAKVSAETPEARKQLFAAIVNTFGNPESQEDYTYHSATRDKDIHLFEDSYISDKDGDREEGFSYSVENLPDKIDYYQYVDEANFSGQVVEQTIRIDDEYMTFHSTNTERMWVTIIPVLGPRESRNELLAFVDSGYLYIYNSTQITKVPAAKRLGLPIHLPTMFKKRMDVMIDWLSDELSEWLQPGDYTE